VIRDRFDGWIAGLGTRGGLRVVIGHWPRSPLGGFTDAMVEQADGHRLLLAPDRRIADYVAATYRFDEVLVVPVSTEVSTEAGGERWRVLAGPLRAEFRTGARPPLGWLLRAVPRRLATAPVWVRAVDRIARLVLPGVRTVGSAGGGREELYAALDLHRIRRAEIVWHGVDTGGLARVEPPVRFGFGSTPAAPSLVRVVSQVSQDASG
jgi:hypothetical protein